MNRAPGKKLLQSQSKFECLAKLVEKACDPINPRLVKSLAKNRVNLDETFQELYHDHRLYKLDVNDTEFNYIDENEAPKYDHNDNWLGTIEEQYYELVEKSDLKLESLVSVAVSDDKTADTETKEYNIKYDLKLRSLAEAQIKAEKKSISDSITKISETVSAYENNSITFTQANSIRVTLGNTSARLDGKLQSLVEQILQYLDEKQAQAEQTELTDFLALQRTRIDSIELAIVSKIKEASITAPSIDSGRSLSVGGRTYLKKVEPPTFNGDILEFPEFKRKWAAVVSRENLEEESELDRLRDQIPESARKMLIGEKSLVNAWKILTKLYGNKTLLANKLKSKLKSVSSSGKEDHDVIINLCIEVKSIICSLTELGMQEMLKYDDEYLSAVFRALPTQERTMWLKFDKKDYDSEWKAMETFLELIHEEATNTKVLLSNYIIKSSGNESIKCRQCHKIGHKRRTVLNLLQKLAAPSPAKFLTVLTMSPMINLWL